MTWSPFLIPSKRLFNLNTYSNRISSKNYEKMHCARALKKSFYLRFIVKNRNCSHFSFSFTTPRPNYWIGTIETISYLLFIIIGASSQSLGRGMNFLEQSILECGPTTVQKGWDLKTTSNNISGLHCCSICFFLASPRNSEALPCF